MRLSRRAELLLRVAVGLGLAFIYIPLIVIAIYAFNGGNSLAWPPPDLTTKWFGEAIDNQGARDALWTSIRVGAVATAIALLLGCAAPLAAQAPAPNTSPPAETEPSEVVTEPAPPVAPVQNG